MAIRLREVEGVLIALCAAETDAMPNDVYIDDGQHYTLACPDDPNFPEHEDEDRPGYVILNEEQRYAITMKLNRDHKSNGLEPDAIQDELHNRLAETQKLRDAETELLKWLAAIDRADAATAYDPYNHVGSEVK